MFLWSIIVKVVLGTDCFCITIRMEDVMQHQADFQWLEELRRNLACYESNSSVHRDKQGEQDRRNFVNMEEEKR